MVKVDLLEEREDGIKLYQIINEKIKLVVANIGCRINELHVADAKGHMGDIITGLKDIGEWKNDYSHMGEVIGRCANRIGDATFTLNGIQYKLAANEGANHIHGGVHGFNTKIFDAKILENGIRFTYLSPDMEEGYPGNMNVIVEYVLEENEFTIKYHADTDKDTIVNLTNHMYFNLSSDLASIEEHYLSIKSDEIGMINDSSLATGERMDVTDTPFDFRMMKRIGQDIDGEHMQLKYGNGYDHPFMI